MDEIRRILDDAVAAGIFPGGVLLAADRGTRRLLYPFGRRATVPAPGPPTTEDTVYDVASLTKVVATTSVLLRLCAAGQVDLDAPAVALLPELAGDRDKERILVWHLLAHASGLPAWRPFYERLLAGERAGADSARAAIVRLAAAEPLESAPGERSVYSDLGFILLGALAERAGGDRLDRLAERLVFGPIGMAATRFVDLEAAPPAPRPSPVAPTEVCPRRGLVVGEVHDDNCHAAGGILGHAGLFSTAADLGAFAARLCWAAHGARGLFDPHLVRRFLAPAGVPGSLRRLGWDGPTPGASQSGRFFPRTAVGHLGFTGCSLWIDPPRMRWVILLSNRVHPSRDDRRIGEIRPGLHDAVLRWLEGDPASLGL